MSKPKIRFKGYEEDWEQRKLPEFVTFFNGLTYTPDDVEETGTLVLRSSNVKNGEIVDADNVYVNAKVATSENVHEGDIIVVVRNGSRALIGKHAQIKASMPNTVIGAFMSGMRSEHSSFVNALLDTSAFENEIAKNMGATINQITGYMFSKMEFMIPSGDEQQKIGEYFQSLDHLITLHQRKCDETKKLKKYMLQKMFPQNGQSVPEIRFEGFTDDWEQRKLGEVTERVQGNDGRMDLPTLTISAANGWLDQRDRFFSNIAGSEQKNYTLLHKGELSYNHGNSKLAKYGTVFALKTYEEALVPRVYHSFKVTEEANADFLEYVFATKQPDRELGKLISSGARMDGLLNINYDEFMSINMTLPSITEQLKISEYLRNLDHLITLHQNKCEELKKLKKFMLQNMFV